jgi:hypothetical protein
MSEIEQIRQEYEEGKLEQIKKDLQEFILKHRQDIKALRESKAISKRLGELPYDMIIKFLILKERSINPVQEIKEQLSEIEKEKWIRGIQLGYSPDPHQVALEWARLYSPGWRDHRVLSIIYVFEREKQRYLALLE